MFPLSKIARAEGDPKILSKGRSAVPDADRLAKGLGWFSIALGATELLAPRLLTRWLGMTGMEGMVRLFGARELASGVLTLSTERRTGVASRIVGDGLDLLALAAAIGPHNRNRQNAGMALALVAGVTLLDLATSKALADAHGRRGQPRSYADRSGFPNLASRRRASASGLKEDDPEAHGAEQGGIKPAGMKPGAMTPTGQYGDDEGLMSSTSLASAAGRPDEAGEAERKDGHRLGHTARNAKDGPALPPRSTAPGPSGKPSG